MSRHMQRFLAAAAYLFAVSLSFLPGLALWFWPQERDPWLAAHGRRAATVNFAFFLGYLLLAPFTHILGLLATFVRLFKFSNLRFQIPHVKFLILNPLISAVAAPHGIVYALWGPHYWVGIFTSLASLGFVSLWLSAIVFNLSSAWRAARGLGPWGEKSGKTQAQENKGDRIVAAATTAAVSGVGVPGRRRMMVTGLPSPERKRRDQDTPITPGPSPRFSRPRRPPGYGEGRFDGAPGERETLALETALETREQTAASLRRRLLPSTAAFAIYLAAAALLLWVPIHGDIIHMLVASPRVPPSDPGSTLWSLAWWPWAIGHGLNPFYSDAIWAPVGQDLLWTASVPSLALLLAPVTHFFGPIVSYNLIALLAPVLAAWAAYLLCRHITGNFWPALFGGWLFGFSSYEFAHLQLHMNFFVTLALPLAVWIYLLRRDGKLSRWWYMVLLALLALFQFGVSTEILASAVPLGLLAILLVNLFQRPIFPVTSNQVSVPGKKGIPASRSLIRSHRLLHTSHRRLFIETVGALVLAGVFLLPCFYDLFVVHYVAGNLLPALPTDLENFLVPTQITWLGGGPLAPPSAHFASVLERGAYLGLPLVGLILVFVQEFARHHRAQLLLLFLGLFFLISLGPWLELRPGAAAVTPIVLPWILPAHLPVFDKILPIRLVVYVWLSVAVLAAWWLAESKISWRWKVPWAVAVVLSLWPNIPAGNWVCRPSNPRFFTSDLAAHYLPRGVRLVVLPYGYWGYSMLWQAEAHFRFSMVGGYANYRPPVFPADAAAIIADFYRGSAGGPVYPAQLRHFIETYRIRAIIIADSAPSPAKHDGPISFSSLVAPLHVQPIHVGGVWLYRLPGPPRVHDRLGGTLRGRQVRAAGPVTFASGIGTSPATPRPGWNRTRGVYRIQARNPGAPGRLVPQRELGTPGGVCRGICLAPGRRR